MRSFDTKAVEKLISDFIDTQNTRDLIDKCSNDKIHHFNILKELSRGRNSLNYKILQKLAHKKKASETFIIEQTKSMLSYITSYDEPELDNYYEILNVSPDSIIEII